MPVTQQFSSFAANPTFNCPLRPDGWTVTLGHVPGTGTSAGNFDLIVHNNSGDWVDVNIDNRVGVAKTGQIGKGQTGTFSWSLDDFTALAGIQCKITRWRPGVFGVPGNGGGDITFIVPSDAQSMRLELEVVS